MSNRLKPNGIFQSSLIVREHLPVFSRIETLNRHPNCEKCAKFAAGARREIMKYMEKMREDLALHHTFSAAADTINKETDKIFLYRDNHVDNLIGECVGAHFVGGLNGKEKLAYHRS